MAAASVPADALPNNVGTPILDHANAMDTSPDLSLTAAQRSSTMDRSLPTSTPDLGGTKPPLPALDRLDYASVTDRGRSSTAPATGAPRRKWVFCSKPDPVPGSSALQAKRITSAHGILIDSSIYRFANRELIDAIKVATNPSQIHSFSRIQGTFQMFFLDKSWATGLIRDGLTMPDHTVVQCHPVGLAPVRVVVSDVPSDFDSGDLRTIMSDFGAVVGPIRTLRAGYVDPDLPQLLSFRRQVLMKFPTPLHRERLPSRIFVDFNGNPVTFFVSTDVRCHHCRDFGHVRGQCSELASTALDSFDPAVGRPDGPPPVFDVDAGVSLPNRSLDLTPIVPVTVDGSNAVAVSGCASTSSLTFVDAVAKPRAPPPPKNAKSPYARSKSALTTLTKRVGSTLVKTDPPKRQTLSLKPLHARSQKSSSSVASGMDSVDVDDLGSPASDDLPSPLSDASLVALFDSMYRSPVPVLVHVRQETSSPLALIDQLRLIRRTEASHQASPLARMSRQAIYKWEKKILTALQLEEAEVAAGGRA